MSDTRTMTGGARHAIRVVRVVLVVQLIVISLLVWRTLTEADRVAGQVRREANVEVHRQLCQLAGRTYSPPASTADGRRRQTANKQFAKNVLGCKV